MSNENVRKADAMLAAMDHARAMMFAGKLSESEFDEFRRYTIGAAIDSMPMDDYMRLRKSGGFNELREAAGQNPRSEEINHYDLKKLRDSVAQKVAADFLESLWDGGHIDDATYVDQMRHAGMKVDTAREVSKVANNSFDKEKHPKLAALASETWQASKGIKAKPREDTPEAREQREQQDMADYAREWKARQSEGNGTVVERERVVSAPANHATSSSSEGAPHADA